ncbi:apolipoprotein N-acyltransferase [Pontivivens nitratireducens]|uniref:Apolipoprotein N-acyltransferase n=1 Tax=Pontivivens nitratireducens TaxID=2758038 RepID=A0A6G7VPA7_9RHOB|nr:apolipoprotein N-acyltransferase [Pontibrevibacter nitratireducens]QIK41851.1 apolipoprotein N-acyltransferase [Pontibrevibacter nitratireducens]
MNSDIASIPQAYRALAGLRRWGRFLVTLLAGASLTLSQQPWGFWPALLFGIPVIVWMWWARPGLKQAAFTGWTAGFGMLIFGLYWIAEAFLVDIARHGWMIPFVIGGLAAGLSLFWGAAFALARWIAPRPGVISVIVLALSVTAFEMARTYVLTGFPWGMIAYGWMDTPVAQLTAYVGPHMLNLVTLLIGGLLACNGRSGWPTIAAGTALLASWQIGATRLEQEVIPRPDGYTVRLVQPNAPQREKWLTDRIPVFYDRALAFTAGGDYDAVVWPETSVPQRIETPAVQIADRIYSWMDISRAAGGRPALIGTRSTEPEPDWINWYNALAVVGQDGAILASYAKHSLVPGGEFLPFDRTMSRLGLRSVASGTSGGFVPGPGPATIQIDGMPRVQPLICYEAIFPHELRTDGPRPEWIVQITNDAWFGKSSGPWQHLAQARYRAIEQGLPLARAANTGISAFVDPYGRLMQTLAIGEAGFLDGVLPTPIAAPLYARSGDLPGLVLLLAALSGFAASGRRRRA